MKFDFVTKITVHGIKNCIFFVEWPVSAGKNKKMRIEENMRASDWFSNLNRVIKFFGSFMTDTGQIHGNKTGRPCKCLPV
jgi:predicted NUDIX family NTP pyrophosphohydrolase